MSRTRTVAAVAALTLAARFVVAEDPADEQMGTNQFSAVVNANDVYVRSYAGEGEYPVAKVNQGDSLIVVGSKGDWLKVLPPEGVKCLLGQAYAEARTNGMARVNNDPVSIPNVRMASKLSSSYGRIAVTLKPGQDVKVVGVRDQYFEILPPPGAFAYVHKRFVDPVKKVYVIAAGGTMRVQTAADSGKETPKKPDTLFDPAGPQVAETPTTRPTSETVAEVPTTKPVDTASLDALEARLLAVGKLPLPQQPVGELLADYRRLAADAAQPEIVRKNAGLRVTLLELRQDAIKTFAANDAERQKRVAAQLPLEAEAKEIGQRMAAAEFKSYAAVGTVRPSSLAANGRTLFRLTDPASGRTVVYLDDADGRAAGVEGQFVGVKGAVTDDATRQIKLVRPSAIEPVEPNEIKTGTVRSGLTPPSLVATADAGR